jgi:hypothetical protein
MNTTNNTRDEIISKTEEYLRVFFAGQVAKYPRTASHYTPEYIRGLAEAAFDKAQAQAEK